MEAITPLCRSKFQFTHPGRGATGKTATLTEDARRFNSRTPGGVRPTSPRAPSICRQRFNSRTPGGVRLQVSGELADNPLVSIHAPREGCDVALDKPVGYPAVSIHAPREGCDARRRTGAPQGDEVSIHAPREGCDDFFRGVLLTRVVFQFTHPGRGATGSAQTPDLEDVFQFTHPGRGATVATSVLPYGGSVSIHAPREGCDLSNRHTRVCISTVSIHAPREGCDSLDCPLRALERGFNSRTPGGVRLSTNPSNETMEIVSIHAPREGCDVWRSTTTSPAIVFQFTHPGRGATSRVPRTTIVRSSFNSRTPGGVRLRNRLSQLPDFAKFQFTHPGRGATAQTR